MTSAGLQRKAKVTQERSPHLGLIPRLPQKFSRAQSLEIFKKTCVNRSFELETANAYKQGHIKIPIYLSLGEEHIPAAISSAKRDFLIFAQHRAHSYYLSFGGDLKRLIDELLHRHTGCAGGMGGSASIHDPSIGMFGHSGLMGDQVPIAVGAALASGKPVLTVMGDASAEEDYVLGAMGYAATKKCPVLFICEDNDLSILTHVSTRRTWNLVDVAESLGVHAVDITDDPWLIAHHVKSLVEKLPALINVRTCRHLWHAGAGKDDDPEWNRFELIKEEMMNLGMGKEVEKIESEANQFIKSIWQEQLPKT